jgi:hypothetical protein
MKKLTVALLLSAALLGSGCSMLMPKQVELFQDKVQQFPRPDDDFREVQKQAAAELKDELNAIEKNLLAEGSSPDEVRPVSADAWAGRPLLGLSKALDRETAKYIDDVGDFAEKNDENAGKKIEGTGLIQIGYFSMLFVLFIFGFFAWVGLKVLGTLNPPVAIGTKVATLPVKLAARALGQVVKGGEAFKNELKKKATWSADEVATLFREKQERAQDEESQNTIRELTK